MRVVAILIALALVAVAGAAGFVYLGLYDVTATDQHTAQVFWVLKTTMRRAVILHAKAVKVPALGDAPQIARGRALYTVHCVRCHGAPGVAPEPFALGLRPSPANLANTGIEWKPNELYWTIKHGLKLTGMPAWEFRLRDDALWAIVAYVQRLPYETPREYRAMLGREQSQSMPIANAGEDSQAAAPDTLQPAPGDPDRGRFVILQYGCIVCHDIPGVVGAAIPVGPPLAKMGMRSFIGGRLANTPENMVRWLRAPQQFVPDGAMPNLGVSERDARDMAAYLESLK
jgi:mono/diheme cytochrome c family protein